MKTNEEYLKNPGHCPFCNSYQIEGESVEIDGAEAWQEVSCQACEASWTDTYKLTSFEPLEVSKI